jgi:hypothetical protein
MSNEPSLEEIERRIQIVEDNVRELVEQAAAYWARPTRSVMPNASPISRRSSMPS